MTIPELQGPPDVYYNSENARRYDETSRVVEIQQQLAQRCLQMIEVESPALILDVGCGTGWSGSVLSENGHSWVGIDISSNMLDVLRQKEDLSNMIRGDIGNGVPFSPGVFDGAISASCIQWLFQSYSKDQEPIQRIKRFFVSLFSAMKRGSRVALQFYLESEKQRDILKTQALRAGFNGGFIIDNPGTRQAKYFLLLECGTNKKNSVCYEARNIKKAETHREYVLKKKERRRRKGFDVPNDSKYSGRKRSGRFR
jgi:18S rRNA (guanine1575-N7)-methyltransferase